MDNQKTGHGKHKIGDTNMCSALLSYKITITVQVQLSSWPTTCQERCQRHPAQYTTSLRIKSNMMQLFKHSKVYIQTGLQENDQIGTVGKQKVLYDNTGAGPK